MYGKDDRSKDNRKNMKQHNHYPKQQQRRTGGNTSSSSPQTTAVRSIVDVADSSDEPRFARKNWISSGGRSMVPQKNRDLVGTLPPMDTDDMVELDNTGAPMDENARAQLRAGDFKQLSQFPNLGGGHFTFGAEKEWNSIAEGQTTLHTKAASSYFTLNLSLLNCGLRTIPFYKRMDYPTTMFTRQQIAAMDEAAERAEQQYHQRVLRDFNAGNSSRAPSAKSSKAAAVTPTAPAEAAAPAQPDELDELLALTNTQLEQATIVSGGESITPALPVVQPPTPAATTEGIKNEVEQWLDSVLDE